MSPSLRPFCIHRAFLTAAAALVCVAAPGAAQETVPGRDDPPLSVFLDSAGLARAAAALPAPAQELPVPPLFWVEFDSTGAVKEVEPIFSELPVDYAAPVAAAIRGHLKPQAPSRQPIFTHLRVMTGPAAQVDRPPIRRRMPVLANGEFIGRRLSIAYALWRGARRADRPHHRAEVMLRILTDGSADTSSVEVAVSTGDARLDAELVRVASGARFTPGAVEGIPAPLSVRLPIELRTHAGEETPPVAAVVDSAALVRALAGVPAPPPLPQGMQPVFRVRFDGGAEGDTTVEAVYTQIPPSYADPVAAAIRASLKPDAHSWGWFFLWVVGGPQPEVREVPNYNRERNPALANGDSIQQMAATAMRRFEDRAAAETPPERPDRTGPDYEVAVRVRVLPDGRVDRGSIRLLDSTGEPELDREAARIAGEMRFRPAEVRGFPAIGWTVARVVFPNGARP